MEQDYEEALKWTRKAAEQGHAGGQNNLGWAYRQGEGVEQDYVTFCAWVNIAAANGHADSKNLKDLSHMEMTTDQTDKAQELSTEMVKKNPKLLK